MKHILTLISALLVTPLAALCAADVVVKPDIVFIMDDDPGCTDVACSGGKYYETPNIVCLLAEARAPKKACLQQ